MAGATDNPNQRHLLWALTDNSAIDQEQVQTAAKSFDLAVTFCKGADIANHIPEQRWVAVGVELPAERPDEGISRVKQLHEQHPNMNLFAASSEASLDTMRAALNSGAGDFLSVPLMPTELHKAFLRFSQIRPAAKTQGEGEIITVYGARGGLGATTLAVNLAVRATEITDQSVALVDLDLQRGDVAAFLNLTPTQSLAAFAHTYSEIDEMFLEGIITRHPSGIAVLPAPPDIEEADAVGREQVELGMRLMLGSYRYVFVDTPRTLTDGTLVAFEQATHIIVLTDLSIPGLRAGQRSLDLFSRLDINVDRVQVLTTEIGKSGISLEDATSALGKKPLMALPRDLNAACEAMNAGSPLNGRDSVLGSAITELIQRLTGQEQKSSGPRLFKRLFGLGRGA